MTLNDILMQSDAIISNLTPTELTEDNKANFFIDRFYTPDNETYPFNREWFFNSLQYECGELEVRAYNYDIFISQVKAWSALRLRYWQRMYDALCAEYDPLENYNRYEDINTNTDSTGENKQANTVAGFESGQLVSDQQNTGSATTNEEHTETNHIHGNIGVTTSQEMVKQELEVCQYSMYNIIIEEFKEEFSILIYD